MLIFKSKTPFSQKQRETMFFRFSTLIIIFCNIFGAAWSSEFYPISQMSGKKISQVIISGNKRTTNTTISQELQLKPGETLTEEKANTSIQQLKNLRIFDKVNLHYRASKNNSNNVDVIANVSDRWTTIPIFKAGSGGGSSYYTVGAYDVNAFGRYLELGAQYQNYNGKNGAVTWFRNPRFFGKRILIGFDIWHLQLNQNLYEQKSGNLVGAYTNTRTRIHGFAKKELKSWFELGLGFDYMMDDFTQFGLSDKQVIANQQNQFNSPASTTQNFLELNLRLGKLNYDRFLVEGYQSDIDLRSTFSSLSSDENSVELQIKNTYFIKLDHKQNIGFNLVYGYTNTPLIQHHFYLGGLFEVRGYVDQRFHGKAFVRSNIEYRIPSYQTSWLVLQHILFIDAGRISQSHSEIINNKGTSFASAGFGIRFISPKIYRFNARLDVAKPLANESGIDVSFGLQQFF